MGPIEINQDQEFDGYDAGDHVAVFWAKGHGYARDEFIRAVIEYCLFEERDIPRIEWDAEVSEIWQRVIERHDAVEYLRTEGPDPGEFPSWDNKPQPVTILDVEGPTRRASKKCAVAQCREPWSSGNPARVAIEPTDTREEHLSVYTYLCREHSRKFPEPSYRVFMVPVGATIMLPAPSIPEER